MEFTAEQGAKLKKVQLDMLEAFIKICDENNLTYWLIGGTALGAVRHNGFIPWDDDIDVALPRPDYERFLEIAQDLLPEYYFLQHYGTEPNCPMNFAKIRDSRTTYIESSVSHMDMHHGVWIDIFPIDGVHDNMFKRRLKYFWLKVCFARLYCAYNRNVKVDLKHRLLKVFCHITYLIYPSLKGTVKAREDLFKSIPYEGSKYVTNHSSAYGEGETVLKEVMGEGTLADFEHLKAKIPSDPHAYLSHVYGDYMTPPPPEKRVGHH